MYFFVAKERTESQPPTCYLAAPKTFMHTNFFQQNGLGMNIIVLGAPVYHALLSELQPAIYLAILLRAYSEPLTQKSLCAAHSFGHALLSTHSLVRRFRTAGIFASVERQ